MRRCGYSAGVVLLALLALPAMGQFVDVWPSADYPFEAYTHGLQGVSAAVERCYVAGLSTNEPTYFGWWINRKRHKLVTTKTLLGRAADSGVFMRDHLSESGTFDAFWASNGLAAATWTSRVELAAWVGAPTNWFDETPWFALSSHSNGWGFVPAVASNLVWTLTNANYGAFGGGYNTNQWRGVFAVGSTNALSWSYAQQEAENDWSAGRDFLGSAIFAYTFGYKNSSAQFVTDMADSCGLLCANPLPTNYIKTVNYYAAFGAWPAQAGFGVLESSVLNTNGYAPASSTTLVSVASVSSTTGLPVVIWGRHTGDGTDPGYPAWCDEPSATSAHTIRGFLSTQHVGVVKWNVSGGFDYQ